MSAAVALYCTGSTAFHGSAVRAPHRSAVVMETKADLVDLAKQLNPVIGYWDPLGLSDAKLWGQSEEFTIGWLRESEVKHGRIAMFGFIGYIVHENGFRTPDGIANLVPSDLSAPAVWDAIPEIAKWQIILFVGLMDIWRESKVPLEGDGQKHYCSGGKIGYFPTFKMLPHPVPFDLFRPFGPDNSSEERKAKGRIAEINNGRLAMLGLMGFVSEATVPGSVPALTGIVKSYAGEPMAPFATSVFTL
mmetsp:Transcript_14761/g.29885  ORF Transcript_14761/g.29885 Transcript_14761/m.29885 type:complete len:247 (+) Transcript_14761:39-779(+)